MGTNLKIFFVLPDLSLFYRLPSKRVLLLLKAGDEVRCRISSGGEVISEWIRLTSIGPRRWQGQLIYDSSLGIKRGHRVEFHPLFVVRVRHRTGLVQSELGGGYRPESHDDLLCHFPGVNVQPHSSLKKRLLNLYLRCKEWARILCTRM